INQLGDDVRRVAVDRGIEDGHDVRMVERARGPRFRDESPHPVGVGRGLAMQDLQCDLTLEPWIPCAVDCSPTALAERRQNLVWSERRRVSRPVNLHVELTRPDFIPRARPAPRTLRIRATNSKFLFLD